jgi:hypothetical protein
VVQIEPAGELRQRRPRRRDPDHLAFLRRLPCAVRGCTAGPIHAAHIRSGCLDRGKRQTGAGEKPDDRWAVPLCEEHHLRGQHAENELAWWAKQGRDPFRLAEALHEVSGDVAAGRFIIAGSAVGVVPF